MKASAGGLTGASTSSLVGLGFGSVVVGLGVLRLDLGVGPNAQTPWSLAVGALVLSAAFVGAFALGRGRIAGRAAGAGSGPFVSGRLLQRSLLVGGMLVLAVAAVLPLSFDLSSSLAARLIVRGLLWFGFGLAVLQLLRSRRAGDQVGALRVLLIAPATILVAAAAAALISRSLAPATALLTVPLTVAGAIGVVVVPAQLISAAVTGLQDVHDSTRRLTRSSAERPRTVVLVLAANLVLVGLVWGLGSGMSPATVLWDWGLPAWLASTACAALIVLMLTVERRMPLRFDDHVTVAPAAGVLVAMPIAVLVLAFLGTSVLGLTLAHPLSLAGLVIMPLGGLVLHKRLDPRTWQLLGLGGLAIVVALVGTAPTPTVPLASALQTMSGQWGTNFAATVVLSAVTLGVAVIAVIVSACVLRQARLLIYLAAIAGWVLITELLSAWTDATVLNLDVALTALLALASVLWLSGRQQAIDGYEVVLTAVVTASLWLLPLALELLPSPINDWLLAVALLIPAFAAIWAHRRDRRRKVQNRAADSRLGQTCLMYGLLAALVWVIGAGEVAVADNVATVISDLILPPLALLLIMTASAGRATVTPAPIPVRET